MTVGQMLESMTVKEYRNWLRYFEEKEEKAKGPELDNPAAVAEAFKIG